MIFSDCPLKVSLNVSANSGFNIDNSLSFKSSITEFKLSIFFSFCHIFCWRVLIFLFSSSLNGDFLRFVDVFREGPDIGVDSLSAVTVFTFFDLFPSTSSSGAFLFVAYNVCRGLPLVALIYFCGSFKWDGKSKSEGFLL